MGNQIKNLYIDLYFYKFNKKPGWVTARVLLVIALEHGAAKSSVRPDNQMQNNFHSFFLGWTPILCVCLSFWEPILIFA